MKIFIILIALLSSVTANAETSEQNRSDKKIEASLQFAPHDYRLPNSAVSGMYFLTPNDLLGLKLGSLSGKENQNSIAIQYKRYFGNSFYAAPELFYLRSYEEINGFWADVFNINQREYASYKSLGAGVRIGNQWTWKNFTLGCDWIGIGQRFGTFHKDTSKLHNTTYTLLNFIIGMSW